MRTRIAALYGCFLLSGLAALIYEIVWQRMLTLVFGVSTWSIAAILTAYMAGLALGAWVFSRVTDRTKNTARAYALVEIGIAATSLAVSFAIDPLMRVYVHLAAGLEHGFYVTHLIRFGLALAVFIVPSTLIGATVPLMGRLVARACGALGIGFGRFYAVNTFGAVLGAGLAGFALIRFLGMHTAIYVGTAANLLAGIIALAASRAGEPAPAGEPATAPAAPEDPAQRGTRRTLSALAAVAGLTGLGYEIAWSRLLAVYTLNSVYVFTMLLTVFLAALAIGSGLAARFLRWRPNAAAAAAGGAQMGLALLAPLILGATGWAEQLGYEYQYRSAAAVFRLEYEVVFVVVFLPALLLGATLPLLAALLPGGSSAPGRSVGTLYTWNSVGCIAGAALTGVLLIPLCGIRATMMLYALVNFSAGCVIFARWRVGASPVGDAAKVRLPRRLIARYPVPTCAVLVVALALLTPVGAHFIRPPGNTGDAVLYYAEGNSAVVHITGLEIDRVLHRTLYLDSQSVAGDSEALITDQKMLAHIPLLLHPAPQRALTVGFGTGGTSYSMRLHDVETHCVEIERMVPAAASFFTAQNHGVVNLEVGLDPQRPEYQLILDDARSWLQLAREPYDAIVDDLTSIQYRGNGNLYTRECFELIRARLSPDGVGCAWVPITGIGAESLRMVVRTFQTVFPHTSVWYLSNTVNDFVILVGTPRRLTIDLDDWARRMADPVVGPDLAEVGLDDPLRLASCLLLDEAESRCFAGEGAIHTDNRPLLDYLTHAGVYQDRLAGNLRLMLACQRLQGGDVPVALGGVTPVALAADWDLYRRATQWVLEGHAARREGDDEAAMRAYNQAAELVPDDAAFARLAGRVPAGRRP